MKITSSYRDFIFWYNYFTQEKAEVLSLLSVNKNEYYKKLLKVHKESLHTFINHVEYKSKLALIDALETIIKK